ncbi:hypothetical protein [Rhodohalobacter sulfatireducens]|uniref:Uncharacterized protein n=1 Tax=Rhodohalobacter sulfatireducens TaxID=2911366 RepID=A0ABS9KB64_9BACT|nr:hypothetical protein [Rhodohalobacter sulfatireducens]MCG2588100.1 hypothetical protein [Rhodohalobacter sulfatireducens]
MFDFILEIFLDLSLISGVILLLISPFKKFKEHRKILVPMAILFIVISIAFIDWNAVGEAYWEGYHFAKNL